MQWTWPSILAFALWCGTGCYLHHSGAPDAEPMIVDAAVMHDASIDATVVDAHSMDAPIDAFVTDAPVDTAIDHDARDADVDAFVPPLVPGVTYIKPAATDDAGVAFGTSVALSATTLVVAAPYAIAGAPIPGAIYVFVRTANGWQRQQILRRALTRNADFFGISVAISGDTIVAGSRGNAYVYVRRNGTWTEQAMLDGGPFTFEDQFGWDVAIDGNTIVVGAIADHVPARGINPDRSDRSDYAWGAAHVFVRRGEAWMPQAYLKSSNADHEDLFGESVAISGDTIVVGAGYERSAATGIDGDQNDNSAFEAGAAYVFRRNGERWAQEAYLKASNTGSTEFDADQFGRSVAIDRETIVISAYGESSDATGVDGDQWNDNAPGNGAAYVFARSDGRWTQQAYLKATTALSGRSFGMHVDVWGDTVVVGANYDSGATRDDSVDPMLIHSGAAYLFHRVNGRWSAGQQLRAPNADISDFFGWSVAVFDMSVAVGANYEASGAVDINGDQNDNSVPGNGAVYVFDAIDELGLLSSP